ncbi:MAG: MAPEG family protein [Pseudomonas sp.]|jgi:hypothetical protein|nr:MAPEG family protein [Pseudomonas sp.]
MEIIYPMFALVVLTFFIGFSTGISRLISAKKGLVDPKYFKLFVGDTPPESMLKLGRNFSNLLEVPILFYTVCIISLTLGGNDKLMTGFAWVFVILRVIHSIIHITYNNPFHRFLVFLLSSIIILIMWVHLVTSMT